MKNKFRAGIAVLLLDVIACEPVFAIRCRELFIVLIIMGFLFGSPTYRFIRMLQEYRKHKDK